MTYRLPSLNTLRAFEAAARQLSFQTAADEMGVTASAVSQQVRKLEQSLGIDLFRRLPHGLQLTAEGETYLPRITKVFEYLTNATEEIAPDMNGKKSTVGICPKAARLLPSNWPLNDSSLRPYIRDRVKTSDVESVRTNAVDCLIRTNGGPYGHLELFRIPYIAAGQIGQIHVICKTGLANCRQTEEILSSLKKYAIAVSC